MVCRIDTVLVTQRDSSLALYWLNYVVSRFAARKQPVASDCLAAAYRQTFYTPVTGLLQEPVAHALHSDGPLIGTENVDPQLHTADINMLAEFIM